MAEPQRLETRPERLWREWLVLRDRALKSENIQDGIAAGRAWSRFMAEYIDDRPTRNAVHGN